MKKEAKTTPKISSKTDWSAFSGKAEAIRAIMDAKGLDRKAAQEYLYKAIPAESAIQKKIMDQVKKLSPSAFVWKAAAGAYSRQGIPDVCAVVNGKYYGFEVKRPLVGVPSKIQAATIEQIRKAGGHAYIVCSPEEVTQYLSHEL